MAHVQIRTPKAGEDGTLRVIVDGVDISDHIFIEGFGLVQVGEDKECAEWGVSMIVAADVLEVDLPNAVLTAVRASEVQE